MSKLSGFLVIVVLTTFWDSTSSDKEVLVRDRLVFLLCDQMKEYMDTGKFPEPVKVMPEKYKQIKPGTGGGQGRSFGIKLNKTKKGKKNKNKKNKKDKNHRPKREFDPDEHLDLTILDLFDDQ